jgi:phosphate transport system substrate-binding protein
MTAAAWILIDKHPNDPAAVSEALRFFAWAYANGAKMAEELDYVPMPKRVVGDIQKVWTDEIKDTSGKPLFTVAHQDRG